MKTFIISCIVLISILVLINTGVSAGSNIKPAGEIIADDASSRTIDDSIDNKEKKADDLPVGKLGNTEKPRNDIKKQDSVDRAGKKKYTFFDPSGREYITLFIGYGGYFPVADYGNAYKPGHIVSFTAGVYYINFLGLSPELHVRYTVMDYKEDPLRYRASLSQVQVYPAIVYRYPFRLPRNTLTVYGRIWDGMSLVYYKSRDPYVPGVTMNITEQLNVFGLSVGCYYDVWRGFLVGVDVGYSIVSTAHKPLQSVAFMLNVGWRIL
jgi:hypothetical protein